MRNDIAATMKSIGKFFVYYREKCQLSQRDLSTLLGVSSAYIAHIETDRLMRPTGIVRALYKHMKNEEDKAKLMLIWKELAAHELTSKEEPPGIQIKSPEPETPKATVKKAAKKR